MKSIIAYLCALLVGLGYLLSLYLRGELSPWLMPHAVPFVCAIIGGVGGLVYCLRGVYLNACVRNQWDMKWWPWYVIRPIVSILCGLVSYLFLKAGLLVLDATQNPDGNQLGFYALAFIAGLNVDKFIGKIEDLAQATWGIEKSRSSKPDDSRK
jgi:hypothetical protein